jgi:hypothetical protein
MYRSLSLASCTTCRSRRNVENVGSRCFSRNIAHRGLHPQGPLVSGRSQSHIGRHDRTDPAGTRFIPSTTTRQLRNAGIRDIDLRSIPPTSMHLVRLVPLLFFNLHSINAARSAKLRTSCKNFQSNLSTYTPRLIVRTQLHQYNTENELFSMETGRQWAAQRLWHMERRLITWYSTYSICVFLTHQDDHK